jgi:hypothetical protein
MLAAYKPAPEEPIPDKSTVGDLIREVGATANFRGTTFQVYCAALRSIAADITEIPDSKSRFAPNSEANRAWREAVDATPLNTLTAESIQGWKLAYLGKTSRLSRRGKSRGKHGERAYPQRSGTFF